MHRCRYRMTQLHLDEPTKHTAHAQVREGFLAEIKEALSNGMALHWPSDDECIALAAKKRARSARGDEQRVARQRERTAKDAAVIVKQANRMAAHLQVPPTLMWICS